jgi:hypothetical protein
MDRAKVKHATASGDWSNVLLHDRHFEIISSRPEKRFSKNNFGESKHNLLIQDVDIWNSTADLRDYFARVSSLSAIFVVMAFKHGSCWLSK